MTTKLKNDESLADLGSKTIFLSKKDWKKLMDALENPPEPTPALIALMRGKTYIKPGIAPHKYEAETTSGIGFCKICFCDDGDHPIHIKD